MAAATAMMAGMAGMSLVNAYGQSQQQAAMADYQKQQMETNATLAGMQADDAIERGDKAAQQVREKGVQVRASQRAGLAAQGIDVDTGSAADVQADTEKFSELDQQTVKNNAWREAWGYRTQANQASGQAVMAGLAGQNAARNTLLTGGMHAMDYGARAMSGVSSGGGSEKSSNRSMGGQSYQSYDNYA